MSLSLLAKAITTGLLVAALQNLAGSARWRPDPYGLVPLGLVPGDGGPVAVPAAKPAGDLGGAIAAFANGDHDEAQALFTRAVLLAPDDPDTRCALGAIMLGLEDFEGALGQFTTLARLRPDAEAHYMLAWAYHGLGRPTEALAEAELAVAARPGWPPGLVRLGLIRLGAGDEAGGTRALRAAAALPGATPETLFDVGNHFLDTNQPAEALPFLRQALALRPDYSWAANNLGNAYKALNQAEEAKRCYRKAIEGDSQNPNPHNGLGVVLENQGDLTGALYAYRSAVRIDPGYMDAHYNAGVVLLKLGRAKDAVAALETARRLRPDFAATYFQLGEAWLQVGRVELAKASHRKATTLDPDLRKLGGEVSRLLGEGGRP